MMMRIVDEITIFVKAGNGGRGCESRTYISEKKFIPNGGEGGRGGNIVVRADANLATLKPFLNRRHFVAESGSPGGSNHKKGKKGGDRVISVPCGTQIFQKEKHFLVRDLCQDGEEVVLAQGGRGGVGNEGKKEATPGEPGAHLEIVLSLRIPADVFLVGLPNSGKSKLLNRFTHARVKEESYPFSTKHPVLGAYAAPDFENIHFCELPGIYRESPEGRGEGVDFLKHLGRARLVVFLLDPLNPFAGSLQEGYETLLGVLERYEKSFLEIPRAVVVNKMDLVECREEVEKERFRPADPFFLISAETGEGVEAFLQFVTQQLKTSSRPSDAKGKLHA